MTLMKDLAMSPLVNLCAFGGLAKNTKIDGAINSVPLCMGQNGWYFVDSTVEMGYNVCVCVF